MSKHRDRTERYCAAICSHIAPLSNSWPCQKSCRSRRCQTCAICHLWRGLALCLDFDDGPNTHDLISTKQFKCSDENISVETKDLFLFISIIIIFSFFSFFLGGGRSIAMLWTPHMPIFISKLNSAQNGATKLNESVPNSPLGPLRLK